MIGKSGSVVRKSSAGLEKSNMTGKGKDVPVTAIDNLYCTVDGWQRTFRFGVNRFPPMKGFSDKEGGIDEWDHLEVFGTVRYHWTNRKTRPRKGQKVVLWIFPTHVPRNDWRADPNAIGGVWTQDGKLFGTMRLASDTFYSLFPCLVAGIFKELEIDIRNMKYRRGDLDRIEFSPNETPIEDLQ
jgi:hypothetical protein